MALIFLVQKNPWNICTTKIIGMIFIPLSWPLCPNSFIYIHFSHFFSCLDKGDRHRLEALSLWDALQQGGNIMDTESFMFSLSTKHLFFFQGKSCQHSSSFYSSNIRLPGVRSIKPPNSIKEICHLSLLSIIVIVCLF